MTARGGLLSACVAVALAAACERQAQPEQAASAPADRRGAPRTLTREQALDSARSFMARSSAAPQVFLDSTAVEAVDSLWRVTFRRRELVIPNVVTVDVHARTGAMRFPGDE